MPKENIGAIQQVFRGNNVMLVNPNPGWPDYIMVLDAVQETVPPLVPFSLPAALATQMYTKAFNMWNQMAGQIKAEEHEIRTRTGHKDPKVESQLYKFLDKDGKEPRTKAHRPPRPFLVRLDTEEGKKHYESGLAEAKEKDLPIPSARDLAGQFPLLMAKNQSEQTRQELTKAMREPKDNWPIEDLREYVENFGGYVGPKDKDEKILEKAVRLFAARKKEYEADGFIINLI